MLSAPLKTPPVPPIPSHFGNQVRYRFSHLKLSWIEEISLDDSAVHSVTFSNTMDGNTIASLVPACFYSCVIERFTLGPRLKEI